MKLKAINISTQECVSWVVAILVLILSAALSSIYYSHQHQYDRDRNIAHGIERSMYETFGGLIATLTSFSTIQQLQTNVERSNIDSYSNSLLKKNRLVVGVSRYEKVSHHEIDSFENEMSEFGVFNFTLKESTSDGTLRPAAYRDVYFPIKSYYPFDPSTAKYIGLNLASLENVGYAIENSMLTNNVAISTLTKPESAKENILLVHPTYLGREVPSDAEQRLAQHDGGYVFEIDVERILHSVLEIADYLYVTIWYDDVPTKPHNLRNSTVLANYTFEDTERPYFKTLFAGFRSEFSPFSDNASVQMSLISESGVTRAAMKRAIIWSLLAFAISTLVFTLALQKRIAEAKRNSGLLDLERQREMALTTLSSISEAVMTTDTKGEITFANPASCELLKSTNLEIEGKLLSEIVRFERSPKKAGDLQFNYSIENALKQHSSVKFPELRLLDMKSGTTQVDSVLTPLREKGTDIFQGSVLVMRDVSAERELTRELEYYATHDSLTKISNRYIFELNLRSLVSTSINNREQHAICYIDLDQFKIVNDTCGHTAGDNLLIQVSKGLENIMRTNDILARLGGDEFGLLIRNCDSETSEMIARTVYSFFQNCYFQHSENVFAVRASIGFVHINGQFESVEDVMAAADLACYSAKDRGRNELHIYSHASEETAERKGEMLLLPKLQKALRYDNFRLFVQPIAGLSQNATDKFERYEILLRLIEDDGKIITPFQLILAAERYDLMREIDRWVIKNSLDTIAQLAKAEKSRNLRFSINLSGQSTVDADLPLFITEQLKETGVNSNNLCFEITETSAIANMQHALKLVDFLHDLGCTIALDDFGSGVSSFGYLKSLPVDYLKIDGQFIKNIHNSEVDREMVKCMQAVASLLGIHTVAEFVETGEIVTTLEQLQVDFAQGYYYAKPHPMKDLFDQDSDSMLKAA